MYDQMSKKTPLTFIIIYMCDIKLITIMIMIIIIIELVQQLFFKPLWVRHFFE